MSDQESEVVEKVMIVKHIPEYDTIEKVSRLLQLVLVEEKAYIEESNAHSKALFDQANETIPDNVYVAVLDYRPLTFNEVEQIRYFARLILNDNREFDKIQVTVKSCDITEVEQTTPNFIRWVE
jgi:hypothetical protein